MNYKIKDLCEVTSSRRIFAREYKTSGIPFFRSQEIIELSTKGKTIPTIYISNDRYNALISKGLSVPTKGDILMSAIGANRGYPWNVSFDGFYFKDGNVIWLRKFSNQCNSKYLTYALSTKKYISMLQTASEHSAQVAITLDLIKNVEIDLPSIENQQHIVNTIGTIDDLIEKNDKILVSIRKLREQLFMKYSSLSSEEINIYDIIKFENGAQPPKSEHIYENKEGYIRFVQNRDYYSDSHITYIPKSKKNHICSETDIMMDKYGEAGTVRYWIYGAYNVALLKIIPQEVYITEYIRDFLSQKKIKDILYLSSQASTRPSLNESTFNALKIPALTISQYKEYNTKLNTLLKYELLIKSKQIKLKDAKQNLLSKYF